MSKKKNEEGGFKTRAYNSCFRAGLFLAIAMRYLT